MSEGKNCAIRLSDCCYRISRWFPIIVVDVIVLWSYYAYVVQFCFFCVESPYEKIAYLAVFHVAFVLVCLSYWRTTFTHPGEVPDSFQFPQQELSLQHDANNVDLMNERLEEMVRNIGVKTRTATGDVRYCERCQVIKPDRAHHCSACGKCILKMDHHCPWINNCVGFNNYKFFMLFLIYGVVYCIFIGGTLLMYCIKFWKQQLSNKWQVYILFFFAVMILVSLAPLFFYHCFLLLDNRTTLEAFRSPVFQHGVDRDAFNLGRCKNFKEVFGENCLLWFLPVASTPGDGVHFPLRIHSSSTTYNTVERGDSNFKRNVGYGEVKRIYHQDLGYIPQ